LFESNSAFLFRQEQEKAVFFCLLSFSHFDRKGISYEMGET